MFAAFTARTRHTIKCDGLFYGHSGTLYPNDIRLSNPHGLLSHDSNLFLPERGEDNLSSFILLCNFSFMARTMKICNAGNNSTRTATSTHETGKYSNPELQAILASGSPYSTLELQAAYDAGRALGRTEGMLSYQRHLMNQLSNENQKLNQKLQEQKGGQQ